MWRPALQALGLEARDEPRLGQTLGGYAVLKFIDPSGKRTHAASAYYAPNSERRNLTVLTGAHVNKIILEEGVEEEQVRATGVSFSVGGKEYTVSAVDEVILSAGTIQSPQILELSGIGDPQILQEVGIEVVLENRNVGENLQVCIHPHLMLFFFSGGEGC